MERPLCEPSISVVVMKGSDFPHNRRPSLGCSFAAVSPTGEEGKASIDTIVLTPLLDRKFIGTDAFSFELTLTPPFAVLLLPLTCLTLAVPPRPPVVLTLMS